MNLGIVQILKLILALASNIASYIHDKKLMEAGASESILEGIRNANTAIDAANLARAAATKLPIDEYEKTDANNRDNKPV